MLRASPSGLGAGEDRPIVVDGEKAAFVFFFLCEIPRLWICDVLIAVGLAAFSL